LPQKIVSGVKPERKELTAILDHCREGDSIVVWKLDRLGRSLRHLIELVNLLSEKKIGLISLNDPVDTTTAQGRLCFNIFSSLAEFEREMIRERTQAGLSAARVGDQKEYLNQQKQRRALQKHCIWKGN